MTDAKKRAIRYGTTIYAALIIVALAVSYLIYSLIMGRLEQIGDYIIETDNGLMMVSPSDDFGPDYEPDVAPPTSQPPVL